MRIISTNRLYLRPYRSEDWERVHLYAAIPEFSQFDVWGPNSVKDTKQFVAECIASAEEQPVVCFQLAVVLRDENVLVGGCTLRLKSAKAEEALLGFAINPDYQRRGIATEAATALIHFGFNVMGVSRIFAECDTRNAASSRVMEKSGMRLVSMLERHKEIKGVMTDSYHYEILSEVD